MKDLHEAGCLSLPPPLLAEDVLRKEAEKVRLELSPTRLYGADRFRFTGSDVAAATKEARGMCVAACGMELLASQLSLCPVIYYDLLLITCLYCSTAKALWAVHN